MKEEQIAAWIFVLITIGLAFAENVILGFITLGMWTFLIGSWYSVLKSLEKDD